VKLTSKLVVLLENSETHEKIGSFNRKIVKPTKTLVVSTKKLLKSPEHWQLSLKKSETYENIGNFYWKTVKLTRTLVVSIKKQ